MRDSVPSASYSSVCNVLRQRNIPLIPTYRVYRLYDTTPPERSSSFPPVGVTVHAYHLKFLHTSIMKASIYRIAENSRERTFEFFVVSEPFVKGFSAKFLQSAMRTLRVCGWVSHARGPHLYIIIGPEQSAKVFSAKFSFCTETRKFSSSKVFRYTVPPNHTHRFHPHPPPANHTYRFHPLPLATPASC